MPGRSKGERETRLVVLVVAPDKDVASERRAVVVLDGVVLREMRVSPSANVHESAGRTESLSDPEPEDARLGAGFGESTRTKTTATCPSPACTSLMPTNSTLPVCSFPAHPRSVNSTP